jgi:hypothetical protein
MAEPYESTKTGAYPTTTPYYRRRSSWVWTVFAIVVVALLLWWLWPAADTVTSTGQITAPPAATPSPAPAPTQ